MVIFPVLFGRGAMRLGGILVMFRQNALCPSQNARQHSEQAHTSAAAVLIGSVFVLAACSQAIDYTYSRKNFSSSTFEADLSACSRVISARTYSLRLACGVAGLSLSRTDRPRTGIYASCQARFRVAETWSVALWQPYRRPRGPRATGTGGVDSSPTAGPSINNQPPPLARQSIFRLIAQLSQSRRIPRGCLGYLEKYPEGEFKSLAEITQSAQMTEQGSSRRTQFLLVLSPIGGQSTNGNPQPKPGTSFTGSEASLLLLTFVPC